MPQYACEAQFEQGTKRQTCANDTRTRVLHTIHSWFNGEPLGAEKALPTEGNPQGSIFWLDGMAGIGKTTIAQTIAQHYHKVGKLGASFFLSRDNAECSSMNMIFPTIAYQLCLTRPNLQKFVSKAMRGHPNLQSAFPSMQLERLIIEPLEALLRKR
jgi:NB-ARC domain